jgi:nitroreductase
MGNNTNNNPDKTLLELIKKRRSVRIFNGKKVSQEDIFLIIEAAIWAPSGGNNQELRFLILDKEQEMNKFLEFKPFFRGASTIILVFLDTSLTASQEYRLRPSRNLPYVDTGLALANMVLYAKSKGIDSCIVNLSEYHFGKTEKDFFKKIIKRIKILFGLHASLENNFDFYLRNYLKIPKYLKIAGGVVLGFAERYPDINTAMHGGKRIMREKVDHYIIQK